MKLKLLLALILVQQVASFAQESQEFSLQKNQNFLNLEPFDNDFLYFKAWLAEGWFVFNTLPAASPDLGEPLRGKGSERKPTDVATMRKLGEWVRPATPVPSPTPAVWTNEKTPSQSLCLLPPKGRYYVSRQLIGDKDKQYWWVCKNALVDKDFFCFRSLAAYFQVCDPGETVAVPRQVSATETNTIRFRYDLPEGLIVFASGDNSHRVEREFILNYKEKDTNYLLYFSTTRPKFDDPEKAFGRQKDVKVPSVSHDTFQRLRSMSYRLVAREELVTGTAYKPVINATFSPSWLHREESVDFHTQELPEGFNQWGSSGEHDIILRVQNRFQSAVLTTTDPMEGATSADPNSATLEIGRKQLDFPESQPVEEREVGDMFLPVSIRVGLPENGDTKSTLTFSWAPQINAYQMPPLTVAQLPKGLLGTDDKVDTLKKPTPVVGASPVPVVGTSTILAPPVDNTLQFVYARIYAIGDNISKAHRDWNLGNHNELVYLNLLAKYLSQLPSDAATADSAGNRLIKQHRQLMLTALEQYAIRRAFQWASYFQETLKTNELPTSPEFMDDSWKFMVKTIAARAWRLINKDENSTIVSRQEFERYTKEFQAEKGSKDCPADKPAAFITKSLADALLAYFVKAPDEVSTAKNTIKLGAAHGILRFPSAAEYTKSNQWPMSNLWLRAEETVGNGQGGDVNADPDASGPYFLTAENTFVQASAWVLTPESGVTFILRPEKFEFKESAPANASLKNVFPETTRTRVLSVMYEIVGTETSEAKEERSSLAVFCAAPPLNIARSTDFWETQFLRDAIFGGHEDYWLPFNKRAEKLEGLFPEAHATTIQPKSK